MIDDQKRDLSTFGKRLAFVIQTSGYERKSVAKSLGITLAYLSNYEKDREKPDHFEIERFAELLNTSVGWLLNGTHPGVSVR